MVPGATVAVPSTAASAVNVQVIEWERPGHEVRAFSLLQLPELLTPLAALPHIGLCLGLRTSVSDVVGAAARGSDDGLVRPAVVARAALSRGLFLLDAPAKAPFSS